MGRSGFLRRAGTSSAAVPAVCGAAASTSGDSASEGHAGSWAATLIPAGSATSNSKNRSYGGGGQYCSATPVAHAILPGSNALKSGWPEALGMNNLNCSACVPTKTWPPAVVSDASAISPATRTSRPRKRTLLGKLRIDARGTSMGTGSSARPSTPIRSVASAGIPASTTTTPSASTSSPGPKASSLESPLAARSTPPRSAAWMASSV